MNRTITAIALSAAAAITIGGCQANTTSNPTDSPKAQPATATTSAPTHAAPTATLPKATTAQEQATKSAQSYVDMSGFSRAGLIQQLTSSAGEGFATADATYAINHIKVDWNAEAVESAKSYLKMGGFSRASLIQQLHSTSGEGYTLRQATYAANKVGL
jgi:hypothetical protein